MENRGVSPDSIIARGPFVVRHYHPFTQDFECSLGPVPQPAAATLSVEDGSEQGLYLLRMPRGQPALTKLSEDPNFNGFWTADGSEYVHGSRAVSRLTGESRKLPHYPGHFLCFSPDGQRLVSFSYEPPSPETTLHQVDFTSGADERVTVKREDQPWLTDSRHLVPGTLESAHLWQATHLSWQKSAGGRYQLAFDKDKTGD